MFKYFEILNLMLKENSLKLLLALYQPDNSKEVLGMDYERMELILPELTPAGRRSLISHLHKNDLVYKQRTDRTLIYQTQHGKRLLEAQFPVFNSQMRDWSGEWCLVQFLTPPSSDKSFRYLRSLLVEGNAAAISRGSYLVTSVMADALIGELEASYRSAVVVVKLESFLFGDERAIMDQFFNLSDSQQLYSGISREINELLASTSNLSNLSDPQKKRLCSVFDRFYSLIQKDIGITQYYFPRVEGAEDILRRLQKILLV